MYAIHLMSHPAQESAKLAVERQMYRRHGFGWGDIPHIRLTGIGYGKIIVLVADEHPAHDFIPTELEEETGFGGLPIEIQYGGLYRLTEPVDRGFQGRGGGGGGVQGGARASGKEQGTCFGVLEDTSSRQTKYAVVSDHITASCKGSVSVGGQSLRCVKGCGCGKVMCEGCKAGPVNGGNESIQGLGVPKGYNKPKIGMQCNSSSQTSGKINGKVVAINFNAPRSTSLGTGACSISIQDMFQSHPCPTHGDSGGAMWNENGYLIGIITYGSTSQGGKNDPKCNGYNPSVWHYEQVLGLTIGQGVVDGGTPSSAAPQATPAQQQAQRKRQGGWSWGALEPIFNPNWIGYGYDRGFAANQCIMKGIIWYQNKILDTGTPSGGKSYRGAPADFYNMIQLYQGHNLVISKDGTMLYPASNNRATGQGQKLNDCRNGPLTKPAKGCSPSLSGGGGNCSGGDRYINAQMKTKSGNWINWRCMIDSGASFMMCNASQMRSLGLQAASDNCDLKYTAMVPMIIPPAKTQIQMPVGTRDYGQRNFTPTSPVIMSEAVTVVITKDYTILVANDGSGALTYKCGGSGSQQGDALQGQWMYGGNTSSDQSKVRAQQQRQRGFSFIMPTIA